MPIVCTASAIPTKARDLHFKSLVIDAHDDTTQCLLDPNFDFGVKHPAGGIDIPHMREGGLDALFFSIWVPGTVTGAEAVKHAYAHHKIAALIGVEGGHMANNDLTILNKFFTLGVRYMTLTHSVNVDWADSSTDTPKHNGLSDFGKQVVAEMNRLGMIVDISHVSDKTFYDVLAISQSPVIASYSSNRALCNIPRNIPDQMIKDLAAKGGVIQINYHMGFLPQPFGDAMSANSAQIENDIDTEAKRRCGDNETCQLLERDKLIRKYVSAGKLPRVDWTQIVEHIDHVAKLVGADHVGLGSDFDGANMPFGVENASHLPQITGALLKKGYSKNNIRNILGNNVLRVMSQAEATAKHMSSQLKAPKTITPL